MAYKLHINSQTSVQVVTEYFQETDYTILTTTKHSQSIRVIQIWKVQYYIRSHSPSNRHVVKYWKPKINITYITCSFGIKSRLVAVHVFYLKITVVPLFVVKIILLLCFYSFVVPLLPWRYLNTNNCNYGIHWLDNEELNWLHFCATSGRNLLFKKCNLKKQQCYTQNEARLYKHFVV